MTKPLGATAFAGLFLVLVAAALFYASSGTSASPSEEADFQMIETEVSYEDVDGNPIDEIPVGQNFWVRVFFMFVNDGPAATFGDINVALTAPPGCEFVQPSDGIDGFNTDELVQDGGDVSGFALLKVRCTSAGSKQFSATVSVFPTGLTIDPNEEDNSLSATGPSLNVTEDPCPESVLPLGGGSSCPATSTPTPSPTSTPSPTLPPGETPGPTSTPTPTPIPVDDLRWGDLDCDEDVDAVDALKGLQHVAGIKFTQKAGCPKLGGGLTPIPTPTPVEQTPSPTPTPTPVG